jgi:hypothetical protein
MEREIKKVIITIVFLKGSLIKKIKTSILMMIGQWFTERWIS